MAYKPHKDYYNRGYGKGNDSGAFLERFQERHIMDHERSMQRDKHDHEFKMIQEKNNHAKELHKFKQKGSDSIPNHKLEALIAAGILTYRNGKLTKGSNSRIRHKYDEINHEYVPVDKPQKTYDSKPRKIGRLKSLYYRFKY